MMLEAFPAEYKAIADGGPRINGVGKISSIEVDDPENTAYLSRVSDSVEAVLHKNGDDGDFYSADQRGLMVWYKYFFLDSGKPATHVLALGEIDEGKLTKNAPAVLARMVACAKKMIGASIV